ncbi:LacI family DNA-binding transcriptional regulator [Herbiconiux sp. SYSU D00978]|uniref:LacI family DNA-binding transcriptional regulator n=1 Tax=Herbiconiux sp. SYSU D00978 TaxID=2812562 RepID=UPI001A95A18D|nr:LacI family DNA-binding transcriptional regulator [Herbiconiux sp. SYSU D00978]
MVVDGSITLQAVARRAGVSVATASRALAGRGDLARTTRERVFQAANELGYEKPTGARGRRTTLDPRLIEVVLGSFDDAWTDAITSGAREAAFRLGFDLVLTLERADPDDDWPARVATRRPSGVILGIIRPTSAQLERISGLQIPIVLLEPRSDPGGALASIGTTDEQGGYDAGRVLIASGYARFIVVTGEPRYRFGRAREDGFRRAIKEQHPEAEIIRVHSEWTDARVTEAMLQALTSDRTPVGVFACNDEMALTVYRAARQAGRAIPEDVGVVGFNDEPRAARAQPPLTSVRQPLRAMAGRAVELVAQLRGHESETYERIELPSELVIRSSTLASSL